MIKDNTDYALESYIRTNQSSERLHEAAKKLFAAEGATHVGRVFHPFRPYICNARGSRKWDVDGNEYIDYVMGHGALILGHGYPPIVKAIQEQATKSVHYGDNHELEIEWAKLVTGMMPSIEKLEFFACGQEANMMAIRLARVFNGRRKILRFEENFHGWADELVAKNSLGIVADEVNVIPLNDLNRAEEELSKKEYALVMVEGGGAHMGGQIPWDFNFIRTLFDISKNNGTIFLVDEVVTGFRDSPGGWQSIIGIKPDLTTLGKAVGGGLGVGVLGGRSEIMDVLNPKNPTRKSIVHSGTWNANPLTAAAGVAACKIYQDGKIQKYVNQLGTYFRKKGNQMLKDRDINMCFYGRSIVHLYVGSFDSDPGDDSLPPTADVKKIMGSARIRTRLCLHLFCRGISTMRARLFILSAAHTEEDIDKTLKAISDSLDTMIKEGSLD